MISHARFSQQAAYLAGRSNSWAGEVLTLPEDVHKPMSDWSVERYVKMLRESADRIEQMHREKHFNK